MSEILIDEITVKVMKEAYETAKKYTKSSDDTVFVAGAFLNVAKLLYIEAMGEENAMHFMENIIKYSINVDTPTYH
jgi:predicted nucleic acid-binding protein|tara:strand:+ start:1071 stop:1298 length:228 start_codon:yes stop_codon:yes gene_type:complete